jgi:hypothetical protein
LSLGGTVALGLLVGCADRATDRPLLADVVADADLARNFGKIFLDEGGTASTDREIADLKLIRTSRGIEVPDSAAFLTALKDAMHADFSDRRIVTVDGWQVSQVEARLAALLVG